MHPQTKTSPSPTIRDKCGRIGCPNVGRYIPTVTVYYTRLGKLRPNPLPIEIDFPLMLLCRACKQQPETLIRSLWDDIRKELWDKGLQPSNLIKPFVNFETRRIP